MRARIAMVIAALSACAESSQIYVPMPPLEGAQSVVLAVSSEQGLRVTAFDADTPPAAIRVDGVAAGDTVLLEALRYDRSLSDLGLPSGELTPATNAARSKRLPLPIKRLTLELETGEEIGAWSDGSQVLSEALSQFAIPGPASPCAEFTIEARRLESRFRPVFAFAIDEDKALVVTRDPAAFEITGNNIRRLSYNVIGALSGGSRWTDKSEQVWSGGDFGEIYRGTYRDGLDLEFVGSSPNGGQIRWIVGGPKNAGVEVLTLSLFGTLAHYDGNVWRVLRTLTPDPTDLGHGGLVRISEDVAIATWPDETEVMRIRGTEVTREPTSSTTGLLGAGYAPNFGALVGNAQGEVWVDRNNTGRWEPLGNAKGRLWMLALEAYEDGFVAGTTFGNVVQYVPNFGFCEPIFASAFDVRHLVVLGRDILMLGGGGDGMETPVFFLRRK